MASAMKTNKEDPGVFELLTILCKNTASKYCTQNRISQRQLSSKMRSHSYELLLHKAAKDLPSNSGEPIGDLLSFYFVSQHNAKNTAEFKKSIELKNIISTIRQTDFGDEKENMFNILRLIVGLSNSVKDDHMSKEIFQKPFSFGMLEEMLPKPPRESFGSPQPYPYFPSHVFELPFSMKNEVNLNQHISQTYTEYTVQSCNSKIYLPDNKYSQLPGHVELRTFLSPMSIVSLTSTHVSPYAESTVSSFPRLTAPRDLKIPGSQCYSPDVNVSVASTQQLENVQDVFRTGSSDESVDIWELATVVDQNIPDDIWEVVSKMPITNERQLIATCSREVRLWRRLHEDVLSDLDIVSEKQFIRHIMYLTIGVETISFPFNMQSNCFYMRENLVLEGISQEHIQGYITQLLQIGTYYRRLYNFAFNQDLEDHFRSNGLVYEAAREVIRQYLLEFRLKATEVFEECHSDDDVSNMPTLLSILLHLEPLKYEIETIASIYKVAGPRATLPFGAELMSYLFNEISLVTHQSTALTAFNSLFSVCKVYFKFIEKFIFEGELDDRYHEFFIRKDSQYVNCRSKRYWDKGFHITQSVAVPEFLRSLAKFILLCGKSLRLLKLCNPSDPLVVLISSDHPAVKCCASFEQLERQQRLLDVYRTRCLFVSGELVTFDQILLKQEAERKAFTEMATVKQAETLDKIVADRKRLAQLIIAEKQHSLRVLEAAMAESKASKQKAKQLEKRRHELEVAGDKATEEVDSRLRDVERNKIMEYYSKLNMEVEKKQIHTMWKIKRLQLDQSRMQLLSTEERNLKREKLEIEHQKSEVMAMSIESQPSDDVHNDENPVEMDTTESTTESATSIVTLDIDQPTDVEMNTKAQTSSDVFSAICNVAKSFFKSNDDTCDNKKQLDAQGNLLHNEVNANVSKTSSQVIGANLESVYDNEQYQIIQQQAYLNKQKVMAHEFGAERKPVPDINVHLDGQNNICTAYAEAKRNRAKILGTEYYADRKPKIAPSPCTEAQKEAVANKMKVLGVEYNLPAEVVYRKEPLNVAQEEAVRNRKKVLTSEYETRSVQASPRRDARRAGLTLNLKPFGEPSYSAGDTPSALLTPGDLFPRLDLETPTTADVPADGAMSCDIFTPRSECSKDLGSEKKTDKDYLTSDGFNFIVDEVASETTSDLHSQFSPENSPSRSIDVVEIKAHKSKHSVFNILDGSYSLDAFDPFGLKDMTTFTKNYFSSKMDVDMTSSCYTHPAVIMDEVKKRPYPNMFAAHFGSAVEEQRIGCDNIATLTACLQRSVMLPLTYQLEVVNNSILTHFLVNLDMYEHLRSLKDYFFLMDGEFSRSICHNLFAKLTRTLNPQELLNFSTLHNILDKALGSSISHVHKFSEKLSFSISDPPLSFQHSSPDVLLPLSLTYAVVWPLNIILSQEALLRYGKVFHFLIKMRRIFWVLAEDFQALKLAVKLSKQHSRKLLRSPHYRSVQMYRHVMASMIRALDNYIVTTCIHTSWTEFEGELKKARTLDDLYECHVVYIKKVLFRCLLNNRSTPVMKLLNDIFTVVLKFSRVLKAGEWQQKEANGTFTHSSFAQLQELFHLFEKLARYLHKVVTKLMECGYQRHLVELLTMVNLNGYYDPDSSKDEHNNSTRDL